MCYVSTKQEMPWVSSNHQKLKTGLEQILPQSPEEINPTAIWIPDLLVVCRTASEFISVVLHHPICDHWLQQSWEMNTGGATDLFLV
jgi:hypothetical protein